MRTSLNTDQSKKTLTLVQHESCYLLAMSTCLKIIQSITIFSLNEINQIKGKKKTKKK